MIEQQLPLQPVENVPNVKETDVSFYLYTSKQPVNPIKLEKNNLHFLNVSKLTVYIIHGHLEQAKFIHYIEMKNAYLKNYDYNVILVDWKKPAHNLYTASAKVLKQIGKKIHIAKI